MTNRIRKSKGSITISTTINPELWVKCQKFQISWAEALRRGVTQILSENGDEEYINPTQLQRNIEKLQQKLVEVINEKEEIQKKLTKV